MLAVVKDKPGDGFILREIQIPELGEDEVLIKVKAVGICGTDIPIFKGLREVNYPLIPGHEFSGIVVKKGNKVKKFHVGDKVIPGLVVWCGECVYCRQGLESLCDNIWEIGIHKDGAFAEYVKVPEKVLHKLPESLDFDDGALIDPIASAYRPIKKAMINSTDIVVIFGSGPIGLYALQIALQEGAKQVIVVGGSDDRKLKLAKRLGAYSTINTKKDDPNKIIKEITNGKMADVVIEATGVPSIINTCFECLKKNGRLSLAGIFHQKALIDLAPIVRKEFNIFGSICYTWLDFQDSIELVSSGRIKTKAIISHRFELEDIGQALDLINQKKAIKIILYP